MKVGIIPYQKDSDFVYNDSKPDSRPKWPIFEKANTFKVDEKVTQFYRPEDIPLNRRHFIYRLCAPNTLFSELGYTCTEYPFQQSGFNIMDRSDGICIESRCNSTIRVNEGEGWRTSRADTCVKEGSCYWEVEVLNGGFDESLLKSDEKEEVSTLYDKNRYKQRRRDLINTTAHLRFGVSRREASLESPIGVDWYGYGIRDTSFESIHEGRIMQTLKEITDLKPNDRIGFLLKLPPMEEQIKQAKQYTASKIDKLLGGSRFKSQDKQNDQDHVTYNKKRTKITPSANDFERALLEDIDYDNVIRDKIPIRYKNQLFFESTDYVKTTKPEYYTSTEKGKEVGNEFALENSSLQIYLNGKYLGEAFNNLKPFLPPFSELQYNEKFYFGYWKNGEVINDTDNMNTGHNSTKLNKNNKQGLILRNKYVNNNSLGYYPTVSCFNGGTAKIITKEEDLKYFNQFKEQPIKTLETLYKEQIAEDIVWDIIDEVEETVAY